MTSFTPYVLATFLSDTVDMDSHTLDLLEFGKVKELLAGLDPV